MKLSKAQQEVVDKMREGWEMKKSNWTPNTWWIKYFTSHIPVRHTTAEKLKKIGIIELDKKGATLHEPDIYHLTEQHKTQPDSVTGKE